MKKLSRKNFAKKKCQLFFETLFGGKVAKYRDRRQFAFVPGEESLFGGGGARTMNKFLKTLSVSTVSPTGVHALTWLAEYQRKGRPSAGLGPLGYHK